MENIQNHLAMNLITTLIKLLIKDKTSKINLQ